MNKKLCVLSVITILLYVLVSVNFFAQEIVSSTTIVEQVNPFEQAIKDSTSSDPYTRRRAAEQFGTLRDVRAVPYLKKLLKDNNPFVRQAAVDSLGLLRHVMQ